MENRKITGKTQVCGVIGDPIEHTLSPVIQNAAFGETGLDYVYLPFRVKKEELGKAIQGMRALNIRGLNVTIPHKVEVMRYLDKIDPLAKEIGAVNTIVNTEGTLKGYNTDASGFLMALEMAEFKVEKKKIVILGAGGAARAISFILTDKGAYLRIINRTLDAAREISDRMENTFRKQVEVLELTNNNLKTALKEADLLVNTTSVGMLPQPDDTLIPNGLLRPDMMVADIIYNPLKTRLLTEAASKGARVMGGMDMLVCQGAAAFELWTGQKAPLKKMSAAAYTAMGQHEK